MLHRDLTYTIRGAAFKVHSALGPGLLESAYETCLVHELRKSGCKTETQVLLPFVYDSITVRNGYRIDVLVEDSVILELKAVEATAPIHVAQLLTYMKLAEVRVGMLMNFNVKSMKDGIKRYIL